MYKGALDSRVLGDDRFVEKVLAVKTISRKPSLDAIVKQVCNYSGVTAKELRSASRQRDMATLRGVVGWLATRLEAATLSEAADRFDRDLATTSRAVQRIEERREKSKELQKQLDVGVKELEEVLPWREALLETDNPGVCLAGARHKEGFTQRQLAEMTKIPQRHISEMENGKRPIGKKNAKIFAVVLDIDFRALL